MPLLGAFLVGQRRVQDGDFVSEHLMQVGSDGRSQADLRDQQNGRASGLEHRSHGRQIDRGLARSGDAVQQHAGELARVHALLNAFERRLLRRIELEIKQAEDEPSIRKR